MRSVKNYFKQFISDWTARTSMTSEERYLSQSTDLVDLERRQRRLMYGNRKPNDVGF